MINIVLLMAGNGSRFGNDGYKIKKPFLPVFYNNEILEMYKHVLLNVLNIFENNYGQIILIKKEEDIINLDELKLFLKVKGYDWSLKIIDIKTTTDGAAITALKSEKFVDNSDSVVFINSDQLIELNKFNFKTIMANLNPNRLIFTFKVETNDNRWSYAKLDSNNNVMFVVEKNKISSNATVGIYYFKEFGDFKKSVFAMIENNDKFNNEFYLCPSLNYGNKNKMICFEVDRMYGLGTPSDYENFLSLHNYKFNKLNNRLEKNENNIP